MQTKTALAVAGSVLAVPSTALAATTPETALPGEDALRASGRLTRDADSVSVIHRRSKRLRRLKRRASHSTASAPLEAIAACESGGNPSADTGNGFYGKYQFTMATWQSVGGSGNPAAASEAEQDRRAARLYAQAGSSPWPVCGQ